jgi:hypothetical protein
MKIDFFMIKDSKGRESRTLAFVAATWLIMTLRFIAGGIEFAIGPVHWAVQPSMVLDYGGAVTAILLAWVGRDWVQNQATKAARAQFGGEN